MDQVRSSTPRCGTASSRPASRSTWARSSRSPSSWRVSASTSSRPGSRSRARATSRRSRPSPRASAGSTIAGLSRTGFKDVDRAWEAVRHAERPRIHVFIATSPIHMKKKLRMTEDQVKDEAAAGVARAKGLLRRRRVLARGRQPLRRRLHVRGVPDRRRQRRDHAQHPRHRRLRRARGVRRAHPYVLDRVRGDYVVSTHCHNDLGLAVANSLAGVRGRRPAGGVRHQRARASGPATPRSRRS